MTRKTAVPLLVFCQLVLGCSAGYAQVRFSQAAPISGSQFFGALKEVSLDLRSDPSLTKFVPLAEQQNDIAKALAGYGISVRPNAQVTLVVTATHHAPVIESKSVTTGQVQDSTAVHGIYILAEFFLRTAALRNGRLHLVMAAPALAWYGSDQAEDSGVRKFLLGDTTQQDIRDRFVEIFGECLKKITQDTAPQQTPWFIDSWTAQAKAAADADYVKLMSPGAPVDKNPLEGLNSAPQITLDPRFNGLQDSCKADPNWNNNWTRVFQRLGWTSSQPPALALTHFFSCVYAFGLAAPRYFALSDVIYLLQSDLVFDLNGRPFRAWGELYATHHEKLALEDTLNDRLDDFIPRNVQDFLTDLALGNGPSARAVSAGPPGPSGGAASNTGGQPPAGAIPKLSARGTRNAYLQYAPIVAWNSGSDQRWYYETGTPVPDAYQLTGVLESPLFDLRFKNDKSPPDGFRDKINQFEAVLKNQLPAGASLLDEQLGWICEVYNGTYDCSHLYALDFAKAEFVDTPGFPHVLIPCRSGIVRGGRPYGDALCAIKGREWKASYGDQNKVVFIGLDMEASVQTGTMMVAASPAAAKVMLSTLPQLAAEFERYFEPKPVRSVPAP